MKNEYMAKQDIAMQSTATSAVVKVWSGGTGGKVFLRN